MLKEFDYKRLKGLSVIKEVKSMEEEEEEEEEEEWEEEEW